MRFIIENEKLKNIEMAETRGDRSPMTCDTHPFQWVETTATMRPLQMRNMKMAERGRFELPVSYPTHPFQGCALGHYATSPNENPIRLRQTRFDFLLERAMGLEPTTAAMARRYSSQLSYARVRAPLYIYLVKSKEK